MGSFKIQVGYSDAHFSVGGGICRQVAEPERPEFFAREECVGADVLFFSEFGYGQGPSASLWVRKDYWASAAGIVSVHGGPKVGLILGRSYFDEIAGEAPKVPLALSAELEGYSDFFFLGGGVTGGVAIGVLQEEIGSNQGSSFSSYIAGWPVYSFTPIAVESQPIKMFKAAFIDE